MAGLAGWLGTCPNTTKLSGCWWAQADGGWPVVGEVSVFVFSDGVVVVAESFDGAGVGSMSSGVGVFEDFVDGLGAGLPELLRGKSPTGW